MKRKTLLLFAVASIMMLGIPCQVMAEGVKTSQKSSVSTSSAEAAFTENGVKYGYFGKINESLLNVISEGDSIYLLPKDAYALGLFINLKLFKEAGLVNPDGSPIAPKTF